jgi:MoaA/NifB/PqqE/SkfB family radical SAM enzyme
MLERQPTGEPAGARADARGPVAAADPSTLYLEVTNRCNSLCTHCPRTYFPKPPRDLSLAQIARLVEQVPGLRQAVLHGVGEPLLNPELPAIIRYLKGRGLRVLFNSNVIGLRPRLQEELVRSGLDEYRASLDAATSGTYQTIRGVPCWPEVVANLAGLLATRRRLGAAMPKVSVWFVVMRENLAELPAFARQAVALGVDEVYAQRLVYFDAGLAVEAQSVYRHLTAEQERLLAEAAAICAAANVPFRASGNAPPDASLHGANGARPWQACQRPWTLAYVSAEGHVHPCCFVPFVEHNRETTILGNAFAEPLLDVWNGPRYQAFRARFLSDQPFDCCKDCGSKWSL